MLSCLVIISEAGPGPVIPRDAPEAQLTPGGGSILALYLLGSIIQQQWPQGAQSGKMQPNVVKSEESDGV